MESSFTELLDDCLAYSLMEEAYFSLIIHRVRYALGENADITDVAELAGKVISNLLDHEWITLIEPLREAPNRLPLMLPKERLVPHILRKWRATGYRELEPCDMCWYVATPKGYAHVMDRMERVQHPGSGRSLVRVEVLDWKEVAGS